MISNLVLREEVQHLLNFLRQCLNCPNQWSGQDWNIEHFASLAIPIPDELVNKIVKSENKEQGRSLKENKNKNKLEK